MECATLQTSLLKNLIIFTFIVGLSACGGGGGSDNEEKNQTPQNQSPIANAGADQTVDENTSVTLSGTGTGTDSDGSIVVYSWIQTSGTIVTLSDALAQNPSFLSLPMNV